MNKGKGRIALVTGATGGLGTAMCKKLAEDGYVVCANYRSREKAEAWFAETKSWSNSDNVHIFGADVTNYESVGKMIEEITAKLGPVEILVNNAGIDKPSFFHKMSEDQWHAVIETNLTSVFNCTRNVINGMRDRGYGRIINISSVNGQRGQFGQTNYSAAKAGMHGFTKSLAMEAATKGITVNTISPGYIATDMVMAVKEEIRNGIISSIPLGRLGGTDEVAYLVSFLASEESSFITGANYSINGGQHVY